MSETTFTLGPFVTLTADQSRDRIAFLERERDHWEAACDRNIIQRVAAETALQRAREALEANKAEILHQSGKHYTGCNCTFCNVITRIDAALKGSTP